MIRHPPRSTLFPSPPLFRSRPSQRSPEVRAALDPFGVQSECACQGREVRVDEGGADDPDFPALARAFGLHAERVERSEEHTSELQSPCNLVCRLLLEKKNQY